MCSFFTSPYSHFVLNGDPALRGQLAGVGTSEVTHENGRTRKNSPVVKVYCLPDERAQLQANAAAARMSVSSYMLQVALCYEVPGGQDHQCAADLIRVCGDQGRLAGLFKLWLTNEERVAIVGEARLREVLEKIETTREELRAMIRQLVVPRTGHQEL